MAIPLEVTRLVKQHSVIWFLLSEGKKYPLISVLESLNNIMVKVACIAEIFTAGSVQKQSNDSDRWTSKETQTNTICNGLLGLRSSDFLWLFVRSV